MDSNIVPLILACAVATYATRIGGHLILSRFGQINHRIAAALDAVPTAVIAALVAPSLVTKTPAETLAILVCGLLALRFSLTVSVAGGLLAVVAFRHGLPLLGI